MARLKFGEFRYGAYDCSGVMGEYISFPLPVANNLNLHYKGAPALNYSAPRYLFGVESCQSPTLMVEVG